MFALLTTPSPLRGEAGRGWVSEAIALHLPRPKKDIP